MNPGSNYDQDENNKPSYENEPNKFNPEIEPPTIPDQSDVTADRLDTEPATQPTPVTNQEASPATSTPLQPKPAQAKSKKALVGGLVAAGLVVLLGGSAAAYNFWYQNPQKVVTDSIVNMLKSESATVDGTIEIKGVSDSSSSVDKITVTLDSKSTRSSGAINAKLVLHAKDKTNYTINGSALYDSDANLYFKVKDVEQLAKEYMGTTPGSSDYLDKLVEKVDNKWIRISASDYKDISQEASKTQECLSDAFKKFEKDKDSQAQIADAYRKNQFIVIKEELGSKDGNLGYRIGGDSTKGKAFAEELKNTDIYKQLKKCDDSFEINTDDVTSSQKDDGKVGLEVWISQFGHELSQAKVTVKDDEVNASFVFDTKFNQLVTVKAPSEYVPLKDLIEDVMNTFMEQMTNSYQDTNGVQVELNSQTTSGLEA